VIKQSTREAVNQHRVAARNIGDGSNCFLTECALCFARRELMANESHHFAAAELLKTKARGEHALSEPEAWRGLLQPGEKVRARQQDRGRVPVIPTPRAHTNIFKN
jgi:hypothetical protein